MSNQYFENNPNIKSVPFYVDFYFYKHKLTFKSDNGVFSKHNVDFGTNLLLKNVSLNDGDKLLDMGCGIGIMGISLAKKHPSITVDMVDVNLRAIDLVKENILGNNISNAAVFESNVYSNVVGEYNVIVTNPPIRAGKSVVHDIVLNGKNHLTNGGKIYVVIQKKQGAESAYKKLQTLYTNIEKIAQDKGYWIIKCQK